MVLDTNVALDWLLFADSASRPLATSIQGRHVTWVATEPMRNEFADVLQRGLAERHGADLAALLAAWDAHASLRVLPATIMPVARLRCSDPSDQMFFDLALATGARHLVSRDLAVLKLARQAATLGFAVIAPAQWGPPT